MPWESPSAQRPHKDIVPQHLVRQQTCNTHQELQVGQAEAGRALQVRNQASRCRNNDVRAAAMSVIPQLRLRFTVKSRHQRRGLRSLA